MGGPAGLRPGQGHERRRREIYGDGLPERHPEQPQLSAAGSLDVRLRHFLLLFRLRDDGHPDPPFRRGCRRGLQPVRRFAVRPDGDRRFRGGLQPGRRQPPAPFSRKIEPGDRLRVVRRPAGGADGQPGRPVRVALHQRPAAGIVLALAQHPRPAGQPSDRLVRARQRPGLVVVARLACHPGFRPGPQPDQRQPDHRVSLLQLPAGRQPPARPGAAFRAAVHRPGVEFAAHGFEAAVGRRSPHPGRRLVEPDPGGIRRGLAAVRLLRPLPGIARVPQHLGYADLHRPGRSGLRGGGVFERPAAWIGTWPWPAWFC